jgi:hypothetical protein
MKKEEKTFIRWTDKERELLAHLVGVAFEANGNENVSEACKFAASKLGRSAASCAYQYTTHCKGKVIDKRVEDLIVELPMELPKYIECEVEILRGGEDYTIRHFGDKDLMIKIGDTVILLKLQESPQPGFIVFPEV